MRGDAENHVSRVGSLICLLTVDGETFEVHADGAEEDRVVAGEGRELGFAPITEIRQMPRAVFVGPLPAEAQNYTAYAASLLPGSPPEAAELLRHLAGPVGRAGFEAAGVEAMP